MEETRSLRKTWFPQAGNALLPEAGGYAGKRIPAA